MSEEGKFGFDFFTCMAAARLVDYVGVKDGQRVLDVGTGSGVVAVTAARCGAQVVGLDNQAELLERGKVNAKVGGVSVDWQQADAEQRLPFDDATFDVALSQFGTMMMPNGHLALADMLRVLKPGGRLGLATWPPDISLVGCLFSNLSRLLEPTPGPSLPEWGKPDVIRGMLGEKVKDLTFDVYTIRAPYLSPQHHMRDIMNQRGSTHETRKDVDAAQLGEVQSQMPRIVTRFFDAKENVLRLTCLLTSATKV